jgi:hypothetical protein
MLAACSFRGVDGTAVDHHLPRMWSGADGDDAQRCLLVRLQLSPLRFSDEAKEGQLLHLLLLELGSLSIGSGTAPPGSGNSVGSTAREFAAKIEELRAVIADKITELEENPGWGSEEARQEVIQALDELVVQAQALSEVLQQQDDDVELDGEEG